ncbi:MAG: hypothetical protein HY902_17450, partial [Deltaproteobacteria bacterium]|nr:hypothetical protein [Deltaproteobacteria bacterium]
MNVKLTVVYLTLLSGCAVHLRAPEPDLRDQAPLRPSALPSNIAAVARIPYSSVAALVEAQLPAKLAGTEKLGMIDATWQVWRDGAVGAHADQRGRLCFDVPFGGKGQMAAFGQRLDRELRAQIQVCAQPVLDGQAVLRLKDAEATGAQILTTACPFCYQSFFNAAKEAKSNLQVLEILEILNKAL